MPLFKYVKPERVDVVENCRIRFTPANEFNDPFECLSDSKIIEHPFWQQMIEDAGVAELVREEQQTAKREGRPIRVTEEEFRRLHRERYRARLSVLKAIARDQMIAARLPFRILCLSRVPPDDPRATLMWGHYTNNHQGLVLEFDAQNPWITYHEYRPTEPHDAGETIYTDRRPSWIIEDGQVTPRREFLFSKARHWAYEEEYRLIRFAGTPDLDATICDSLVRFPERALVSVTCGMSCPAQTKDRLVVACRRPQLAHVTVRYADMHPDEYRLTLRSLS